MYEEWIVPLKNQLHQIELSIQRLSSQQALPTSSFSLPSPPVTSPLAPQSTPVTPPQQPVKPSASHPSQDKPPPALATSTPTHSQSSCSEIRMAIDTPPTSSNDEGKLIHII